MFLGHFGVGLALKRVAPRTSLGTATAAAQWLDLMWPIFLLVGLEHVRIDPGNTVVTPLDFYDYPWSHSLLMALVWGAVFGGLYLAVTHRRQASLWLGAAVLSHWALDWIVHRPDLPLTPWGAARAGLGLWNSVPATVVLEFGVFGAGVWLYTRSTRPRDRIGSVGFWLYILVLAGIYCANLFGSPPPDARTLALVALAVWLFPVWAAWCDRHRTLVHD